MDDRRIHELYQQAKLAPPKHIIQAENPVQALQWWAVLPSIIGAHAARSTREELRCLSQYKVSGTTEAVRTLAQRGMTPLRALAALREAGVALGTQPLESSLPHGGALDTRIHKAMFQDPYTYTISAVGRPTIGFGFLAAREVVITVPAAVEHINTAGRLHRTDGPALVWPGCGLWFADGILLTEKQASGQITFGQYLQITNSEVRRVVTDIMGWDWLASHLTEVDRAADPGNPPHEIILYDLPRELGGGYRRRLVIMTNASPSRDGTQRKYGEFVFGGCRTALEAQAWAWDVPVGTYQSLARAT